jgi:threonine 3-dehydrogenase
MPEKILITGSNGQLGSVLTLALIKKFGTENVFATDIKLENTLDLKIDYLDVLSTKKVEEYIFENQITQIYHLAAILSAKGEENPLQTWDINMKAYLNILESARKLEVKKVFFPSSIAVFGENAPKNPCRQSDPTHPNTVYGISKVAGENWSKYYNEKYGLDVRSLRYPGIISYQSLPGGGTTDYAVDIFHQAINDVKFTCFLSENSTLPMIYIDDAVRATLELMDTDRNKIKTKTSYNLHGISFSPKEIYQSILKYLPDFEISYQPDFRQKIADSWPQVINDQEAKDDWNWKPKFNLDAITQIMLENISKKTLISKLDV